MWYDLHRNIYYIEVIYTYQIYKIQIGDTLDDIAAKANTTIEELNKINKNLNNLIPGDGVIVPSFEVDGYETYIVQPGDTMYSIAKNKGVAIDELLSFNGIDPNDYIYPNQKIIIPKNSQNIYVTKMNDTLDIVSAYFNTTPAELISQNNEIKLLPEQVIVYSIKRDF